MKTIHFLELQEFAVRDYIERGRVYIYCYPHIGEKREDWFPTYEGDVWQQPTAQAGEMLALSYLITLTHRQVLGRPIDSEDSYWDHKAQGWYSRSLRLGGRRWNYASDSGVVNGYCNYVLDRADLLKRGIKVDLSTVEVH